MRDAGIERFVDRLEQWSRELHQDNADRMESGVLIPTPNVIDPGDVALFDAAVASGLVEIERSGKFNTQDRPKVDGRWSLLSRSKAGGWYNAEYLPQIAAYADAVLELGYPTERVLFELPSSALQLDLAILDDGGRVVVLGEAKRDARMLTKLRDDVLKRFPDEEPTVETKKRGDEARQLAWRLWTVRPDYLWLIGPGTRVAYRCDFSPLRLVEVDRLPPAAEIGLSTPPAHRLAPPALSKVASTADRNLVGPPSEEHVRSVMATTKSSVGGGPHQVLTGAFTRAVDYVRILHADDIRKGSRVPYLTHLLGVSVIVLEFGGDEEQAIAALLHDAAEDHGGEARLGNIRAEFGAGVARIVEACSDSLTDDQNDKQSWWERKVSYLQRLGDEDARTALVSSADKLHNARAILADYRREGEALWTRFNDDAGRRGELWYYRRMAAVLTERLGSVGGRPHPLGSELVATVNEIWAAVEANADPTVPDRAGLEAEWEQSRAQEAQMLAVLGE